MKKYILLWIIAMSLVLIFIFNYEPMSSTPNFRDEPVIRIEESKADKCMKIDDCLLLTTAGYYEARSEPNMGVVAIMAVVKNRTEHQSNRFPKTIKDVLTQGCEFSYICDGSMKKPVDAKAWDRVATLAYDFYNEKYNLPTDVKFYHSTKLKHKPKFAKVYTPVMTVGQHVFYSCERYC